MKKDTNQALAYIYGILTIFIMLIIISSISTQYIAKSFNYSPNLGETWIYGLYNPLNFIFWSRDYYSFYPTFFNKFFAFLGVGIAFSFIMFIIVRLFFIRKAKAIKDLHGSARWANLKDIEEMGILNNDDGVYIGGFLHKKTTYYLKHNGPEHIIAFAPTRSGKGVGLVLPTLLSWKHSALIIDIKGELWNLTAGWRKKYANNKVLKFDPTCTDGSAVKFNILEEIRIDTIHEIKDTQNIAINLIFKGESPSNNIQSNTSYFKNEAVSFLSAITLFMLHQAKTQSKNTPSLYDLYKFINDHDFSIDERLAEMLDCDLEIEETSKDMIKSIAKSMSNKAPQELSGVIGSTNEALNLYIDPIIAKNISKSEFKIRDLMNYDLPVSLYITIPPSNMDRLKPLNNLLINQILRTLTDESLKFEDGKGVENYKHRLLFMGDEIVSLGKLGSVENNIAYAAGYGIKYYFIIQDISQLHNLYGKDESIISNCHVRIAYAPNKIETAKVLSEMSGKATVIKKAITSSGKRMSVILDNVSETIQETQRPIITDDECMRIKAAKKDKKTGLITEAGDMLIFIAGSLPIYGKQILFFKDETFLQRSKINLDNKLSDIIK